MRCRSTCRTRRSLRSQNNLKQRLETDPWTVRGLGSRAGSSSLQDLLEPQLEYRSRVAESQTAGGQVQDEDGDCGSTLLGRFQGWGGHMGRAPSQLSDSDTLTRRLQAKLAVAAPSRPASLLSDLRQTARQPRWSWRSPDDPISSPSRRAA